MDDTYIGTCEVGCNCAFCLSEAQTDQVLRQGPPHVVSIPHGFEPTKEEFMPAAEKDD